MSRVLVFALLAALSLGACAQPAAPTAPAQGAAKAAPANGKAAVQAELDEVKKGNLNYKGIKG